MALSPTPGSVVVVIVNGVAEPSPLTSFRNAPIRDAVVSDHLLALDAEGDPVKIPWTHLLEVIGDYNPPDPVPTDEAWVTETGEAFVTETGEAIIL